MQNLLAVVRHLILQLKGQQMEIDIEELNALLREGEGRMLFDILLFCPPVGLNTHVIVHDLLIDSGRDSDLAELKIRRHLVRTHLMVKVRNTDEEFTLVDADHLLMEIDINVPVPAIQNSHRSCIR